MNLFDSLFNDFINKPRVTSLPKTPNFISDLMNLMNSLSDFQSVNHDDGEAIQKQLGKPDEVQKFTEGDMHFARLIWNTPEGKFIKVVFTNDPEYIDLDVNDEKSLQEQLEDALEIENFELACILRDKIKLENKKAKL